MDPNIMKFLEEDEDETMHSGADVEAFTAELNRDIEGNASTSQQPSDSDSAAALSQGSSHPPGQFLQQWQASGHDENVSFQSGQDLITTDQKEQHASQMELLQDGSDSENRRVEDGSSHELNSFNLPHSSSKDACPPPQDDQNTFHVTQPMDMQTSGKNPVHIQEPDRKPYPERETHLHKLQNMSNQQSMAMGSNNQSPLAMELNDLQPLSSGRGNHQMTSMGISNEHAMDMVNQHATETGMGSQQAMTSGMGSQQAMTSGMGSQQAMTSGMGSQQAMTLGMGSQQAMTSGMGSQQAMTSGMDSKQAMTSGMDSKQAMTSGMGSQLAMTSGMGSQQAMTSGMDGQQSMTSGISNQQSMTSSNQQPGTPLKLNKQVPFGMLLPIIQPQLDKDRAMQLQTLYFKLKKNEISKDGFVRHMRSIVGDQMLKMAVYKLQTQAARNAQTAPNQFQSSQPPASGRQQQAQMSTDLRNPTNDSNTVKSHVVESQTDLHGAQGLNKQQQLHFSQTSFPTYGSSGSTYSPFTATNVSSSTSARPQPHDSQIRQPPVTPQTMTANHLGSTTQNMNVTNMSKFERPSPFSDPKKMQAGTLTQMNSSAAPQQNLAEWPSSTSKESKYGVSSSMTYPKQEPIDQSNEPHHKSQLNSPQELSSLPSAQIKQGNGAPGNLKDESFELQSSRTGFPPSMSMSNPQMSSLTSTVGPGNYKALHKKPLVGQKKPMEAPGSSPPPSSKKQKVSGAFLDQSIEQLNDVTAVSGVNLREEEEQLFSGPKEDSRASEASRRVVQEEEERLILHKIPLQNKVVEIMAKCGLKNMSNDVERCLSLCVEERMRGFIANLIRLSKQRVDTEKPRHRTVITSDVRQQIMTINRKAREEWEKKQAETEKSQKLNEPESNSGIDGDKEKDETRLRSAKANKDEDDKMRTTAANVAVRAATGVGDMLSRWQLMIEAKQKQGGTETLSGSQPGKDVASKPLPPSARNTKENQESEKRDRSASINTPALVRKIGRNQVVVPRVARTISVKDVISILEREPQMSKSSLIYRLYEKIGADAAVE